MSRSTKEDLVVLGVLIVLVVAFLYLKANRPHVGPKPLSDLKVAEAWLQCIDCQGSFLQRINGMTRNRDTVTRFLRSALLSGPDSARKARRERALVRTWRADSLFLARSGQTPVTTLDTYVAQYRRSFEVMWRSRAATALGVIRGDTALAALNSALQLPLTDKGDTTIHRMVEEAIADSALGVLTASVPAGGTAAAGIGGRVIDPSGNELANVQVTLIGTSIAAVTGSSGQYTLIHVPPGTYTLQFRRIGFQVGTVTVTVTSSQTITQNFTLQP